MWEYLKTAEKAIVLYGMGNGADKIIKVLEEKGIAFNGVFSSSGFKKNKLFHGLPLESYEELKCRLGEMIVLLCFGTHLPNVMEDIKKIAAKEELYAPDVPVVGGGLFDKAYFEEHKSDYDPTQAPWNIYVYRIRSIVVDEGVTCVGSYAFFKCIYASSVTLPDSVTEIGAHAFEKCVSLETIDLAGVKSIGEFAFSGCKALTEYTVDSDAVCANNAFEGAGKRPLGCGGSAFGAAPIAVVIAAAFVLSRKKFN